MAAVTWRCVPPGTCYVPPREPFEKCCVRAAAQTGSGREPKLSGQKRLGLNCVPCGESAPRGQNCAPKGQYCLFSHMPSSADTLRPGDPKFGIWVHVSKGYPNMQNLGGFQKLEGQNFGFLEFFGLFFFLRNSSKNVKNDIFWKIQNFDPPIFPPPSLIHIWKPLFHSTLVSNFVKFRQRVSELEGIRLKNKTDPCGVNFDPSGSKLTWHMCHTRMHVPCNFGVCVTPFLPKCSPTRWAHVHGTDSWRHISVTNQIAGINEDVFAFFLCFDIYPIIIYSGWYSRNYLLSNDI